ncbi:hypothetical protein K490DRAFT_59102 [Saccharata proteae CBS 121410]|uniref:BZIP domain-containing protein n=1 Tax=Saccharata proteae CBS 121410 TaxID=1314787 RepID=A0A9P4HTF9_9PEZI|nr:hypothetical protein K490DRAFT_59102 [Saccharata proteae CBS 121410]
MDDLVSNHLHTSTTFDLSAYSTPDPSDPPTTIKMEDLHQHSTPMPDSSPTPSKSHSSSHSEKMPPKKRKSWGQVLPEPKTNLPPRKRAKTADEKEQRRIERVKRNRLAAHNSRERKREEMDRLTAEKDEFEHKYKAALEYARKLEAELNIYRNRCSEVPSEVHSLGVTQSVEDMLHSSTSSSSASSSGSTINPREASFASPATSVDDYDSPVNTVSQPPTPGKEPELMATSEQSDPTQHSAAMLCDLQCRSDRSGPASTSTAFRWIICMMVLQLRLLLLTTTTSSPPSSSTRRRTSSTPPSTPTTRWSALWAFTTTLLAQSLATCTPTQAQHLLLATGLALQRRRSGLGVAPRAKAPAINLARNKEARRALFRLRRTLGLTKSTASAALATEKDVKRHWAGFDGLGTGAGQQQQQQGLKAA